jgi:acylphosphatase
VTARVRIVLRGRVQGVGFRRFVERVARGAGVAGWVRNRADGSVELVAEGTVDQIETVRAQVRLGPPGAAVLSFHESAEDEKDPLPRPFAIRRDQ